MSIVDQLLKGSIDIHVHHGPDPRLERRVDALDAVRQARDAGMRAIVLKSHAYPTTPLAQMASKCVEGIAVFGGICLDHEVGGLNPYALEASARIGAKVVWMPTFASAFDLKQENDSSGITILDDNGRLLPVVMDILEIVKRYNMVLATGHLSSDEVIALVEAASSGGIKKLVATHPLGGKYLYVPLEKHRWLAEKGVCIEHTFNVTMPTRRRDPKTIVEAVRTAGVEHCIISTDFGQDYNPAPAEGMRLAIATLLKSGLNEKEMEILVKVNPARLLDLE